MNITRSESYSRNSAKVKSGTGCAVCGKEVKRPRFYIHLCGGGDVIVPEGMPCVGGEAGCLALQPVGGDCLRKNPSIGPFILPYDYRVSK